MLFPVPAMAQPQPVKEKPPETRDCRQKLEPGVLRSKQTAQHSTCSGQYLSRRSHRVMQISERPRIVDEHCPYGDGIAGNGAGNHFPPAMLNSPEQDCQQNDIKKMRFQSNSK